MVSHRRAAVCQGDGCATLYLTGNETLLVASAARSPASKFFTTKDPGELVRRVVHIDGLTVTRMPVPGESVLRACE
jgi:hypothetical protein